MPPRFALLAQRCALRPRASRTAHLDFTGTGPEVFGNCNAPPAVTYSAVIYVLRCLAGSDIPLNQGCLAPITMHIPKGCILHPSDDAAVVGGNVLTSQRVVDVVLRAFRACAASQVRRRVRACQAFERLVLHNAVLRRAA